MNELRLTAVIYDLLIHHGYKTLLIEQFKWNHYAYFID